MKFAAAAVLAASAVSGASVKRQAEFYSVSDFTASCVPHSALCTYNFNVMASAAAKTPVECDLTAQGDGAGRLPATPLNGCKSPYYSFSVTRPETGGGLALSVTTELSASSNVTGTYQIPEADITTSQSGTATIQSYIGPADFKVEASVVNF